jgi:hypothetical protein
MDLSPFAAALLSLADKKDAALISRAGPATWLFDRSFEFTQSGSCAKSTIITTLNQGVPVRFKFTGTGSFEFFCNEYMAVRGVFEIDQFALFFAELLHKAMADSGSPTLYLFACACRAGLLAVLASIIHLAQNERKKRKEPDVAATTTEKTVEEKRVIDWFDDLGAHAQSVAFGWALDAKAPASATQVNTGTASAFIGLEARNEMDWKQITLAEAFLWLTAEYDQFEAFRLLLSANTFKRNISVFNVDVAASRLANGIRRRANDIRFDGRNGAPRISVDGQRLAYGLARYEWMPVEQQVREGIEKRHTVEQFVKLTSERDNNIGTELVDQFVLKAGAKFMVLDEYDAVSTYVPPPQQVPPKQERSVPVPQPIVAHDETSQPETNIEALRVSQGFYATDDDADVDDKPPTPRATASVSSDQVYEAPHPANDGGPPDSELMPPPPAKMPRVDDGTALVVDGEEVDLREFMQ